MSQRYADVADYVNRYRVRKYTKSSFEGTFQFRLGRRLKTPYLALCPIDLPKSRDNFA